jgi:hypothetical protein
LGLTLAGPILPLYWVKPAGSPKLIGARQIFSFCVGFLRDDDPIYCGFKNIHIGLSIRSTVETQPTYERPPEIALRRTDAQ